jgi:hypothetical protein
LCESLGRLCASLGLLFASLGRLFFRLSRIFASLSSLSASLGRFGARTQSLKLRFRQYPRLQAFRSGRRARRRRVFGWTCRLICVAAR